VAGSRPDEEVEADGVRLIGLANLPGRVAVHASQMFSANMLSLVSEFWDPQAKRFHLNFDDEILKGCVITHEGRVVNAVIAGHYGKDVDP
jgi:H+-translocating NAD(P) transhydrogenase subunit alpha